MPAFQSVFFCPRVIAYNESFVPAGKCSETNQTYLCLWDESTAGRNAHHLASTFFKVFQQVDCNKPIILWCDNCSSQNKVDPANVYD